MPDEKWPREESQRMAILEDFDSESQWGDRRQEIVFIGASMDEAAIALQLDMALLTDDEWRRYEQQYEVVRTDQELGNLSL